MAAITDNEMLVAALRKAAANRTFNKATATTEGAGTWHSLWKLVGYPPAGANPPLFSAGSGYVPTKDTLGAYPFVNAAVNGDAALLKLGFNSNVAGTLIIYDRIWSCSGFGTVVTTLQSITTPGTLPVGRDPNNGLDVEPWLEVYTAPGATAATWTVTGTDGQGNANRTWTYAHPANAESIGQMIPLMPGGASPAACNTMRVPASFQASVSSGTAGGVGLTLLRRLGSIGLTAANVGDVLDAFRLGLPTVYNDTCLAFMIQCTTTATGAVTGEMAVGDA